MNWKSLLSSSRQGRSHEGPLQRNEFEQDYDRVIFSHPFRRLQDKTQVFPLPEEDFVHNRLTHSLEVASVGRSLGKHVGQEILKKDSSLADTFTPYDFGGVVAAASLAHDVGNPPFGHSGEAAISDFFLQHPLGNEILNLVSEEEKNDLINFEGNAQGFRLLNQIKHGLRLTFATLGAFTKYPRSSCPQEASTEGVSHRKFGFFQSEKDLFQQVAKDIGLKECGVQKWVRHPLAFLVEAADDLCYHIIDLEDGCTLDLISLQETIDLYAGIIGSRFNPNKLSKKDSKAEKLGILRALSINELIRQCVKQFLEVEHELLEGSFDKPLIDAIPASSALKEIKAISIKNIYRSRIVMEKEVGGFEVIAGLLSLMLGVQLRELKGNLTSQDKAIKRLLPLELSSPEKGGSTYLCTRKVIDFVSGMTDSFALTLHRKFGGIPTSLR